MNANLVEKYIHGVTREYNKINSEWDYVSSLSYFGDQRGKENAFSVRTEGELDQVLTKLKEDKGSGLRLVVVDLEAMDSPRMLRRLAEMKGRVRENGEIYDP